MVAKEFKGTNSSKVGADILKGLTFNNITLLRETLLKASLESLHGYYASGFIEGIQQISVPINSLALALSMSESSLSTTFVFDDDSKEEEYLSFFFPIGKILDSVLPTDLKVLNTRNFHYWGDALYINFYVVQAK